MHFTDAVSGIGTFEGEVLRWGLVMDMTMQCNTSFDIKGRYGFRKYFEENIFMHSTKSQWVYKLQVYKRCCPRIISKLKNIFSVKLHMEMKRPDVI